MCLINLRVYLPNLRVFLPFWAFFSFFCLQNGQKTPQFTLNLLSTFDQKNETLKCLKKKVLWGSQVLKCGVLNIGYSLYYTVFLRLEIAPLCLWFVCLQPKFRLPSPFSQPKLWCKTLCIVPIGWLWLPDSRVDWRQLFRRVDFTIWIGSTAFEHHFKLNCCSNEPIIPVSIHT